MAVGYPPPRGGERSALWWSPGCWWLVAALLVPARAVVAQQPDEATTLAAGLRALVTRVSPLVDARRAAVTAAQARLQSSGFRPPAVLAAEVDAIPGLRVDRAGSLRVEVQQEFLGGGRRTGSRLLAASEVERAEARLAAVRTHVAAQADLGLMRWAGWTLIAARVAAEDSLLAEAEDALRTRFAVGTARYVDVLRIRSERLRVASERAMALAAAAVGRRRLVGLVSAAQGPGLERTLDSAVIAVAGTLAGVIGTPLPDSITVDSLLAGSAAMRLATVAVARAQAAQRLQRAEQRPRVAAALGAQRFVGENGRMTVGPVLAASVSLPFTTGRAPTAAAVAAARAVDAAQAEEAAIVADVRTGVAAARVRYEAARARLAVLTGALLAGARQEREGALASYRSGELPLIELLDFERALARAEIDRIRARIDAAEALADLAAQAAGEAVTGNNDSPSERGGR